MKVDDIDFEDLEKELDPAMRVIVGLLRKNNEELLAINKSQAEQIANLTEQIADLRHMLFGRKSEKMPSMESEVRRAVEEAELFGSDNDEENSEQDKETTEEDKQAVRRKQGRAKSEKKRKAKRKLKKKLPVVYEKIEVTEDQLPEGYKLDDFHSDSPY